MSNMPEMPKRHFFQLCALPEFWQVWVDPSTIRRAFGVAAIVGTVLVMINQLDVLLAGQMPPLWKLLLTYCVPYCVSSYSVASFRTAMGEEQSAD